jgi:hypothetical protein
LPNLNKNIICGNSLIGTDILEGNLFDYDEEKKLKPMDFDKVFPSVMENGGFDAIVGNPPWISLTGRFRNEILTDETLEYLINKYEGNTYMPNIYEYFVRKGLLLLASNGIFSLIVPDRLGYNKQFVNLRKFIIDNYKIIELLYKAPFPSIITDTLIFLFSNHKNNKDYLFRIGEYSKNTINKNIKEIYAVDELKFIYSGNQEVEKIINKVFKNSNCKPIEKLIDSTSGFGGKSEKITFDNSTKSQIKILRGRSIQRYEILNYYYFDFTPSNITGRTTDKSKLGAKEKVLLRKTGSPILATYDNSGIFPEQSLYFLFNNRSSLSYKYLTAIINSKLFQFVYINNLVTNRDSTPQLKKVDLDRFPVFCFDLNSKSQIDTHNRITDFVDQMLTSKKQLQQAKTESDKNYLERKCDQLDKEIDQLVYQLYGLTEEEIKIVESK